MKHRKQVLGAVLFGTMMMLLSGGCDTTYPVENTLNPVPDNAELLFLSNRDTDEFRFEIYARDAEGGVTRITHSDEQHHIFGIDRSRRYIVATRGPEDRKRLWLLDLESGTETPLTGEGDHAEGRSFSPDGAWLVFWMIEEGESQSDIYKIRRDGTELVNLTNTPDASEFDPAWSNNSDRIAFNYNNGNPNRFVLKTMDSDGDNIVTIADPEDSVATALFPPGYYDPSWSPDDELLLVDKPVLFTGKGENGGAGIWQIFKIRTDGNEVINLTGEGVLSESALYLPSFSPDGQWIAVSAREGPEDSAQTILNIVRITTDGSQMEYLSDGSSRDQFPVWIR